MTELTVILDLDESSLHWILDLLFQTHPAYRDRGSRRAVQDCLQDILSQSSGRFSTFISRLKREASKVGIAPSNAFVLTEWCSIALQICVENIELWQIHKQDLITAIAQTLELSTSCYARDGVKKAALSVTRRALRKLLRHPENGHGAMRDIVSLLSAKGPLGYRSSVLLGTVAGVWSRLPTKKSAIEDWKAECFAFWVREVVGSRSTVPVHIANGLHDFFLNFVTIQDLKTVIVPALEKGLLRAPEIVLNDLVRPTISSLPSDIDLAETLANNLLKSLLSNMKSTNADIRSRALSTFGALVHRSYDENVLGKISNDILTPLVASKIAAAEQRTLHSRMLSLLPQKPLLSAGICDGLTKIVPKEPNDTALLAELTALTRHLVFRMINKAGEFGEAVNIFAKGLDDKRPAFQKVWALQSGNLFWEISQMSDVKKLSGLQAAEVIVPKMLAIFQDIVSNPLPAAQTGIIISGYVMVSLHDFFATILKESRLKGTLEKSNIYGQALALTPKPSFLLNYKAYMKASNEEELRWVIRAITNCSPHVCALGLPSAVSDTWIHSLLYFMTSTSTPPEIRRLAKVSLGNIYSSQPALIGKYVVHGIWTWYWNIEMDIKDSIAVTTQSGTNDLFLAVQCICPSIVKSRSPDGLVDNEVIQSQLVQMLVLCRPEVLPRVDWIETCLRVRQDPGAIAKLYYMQCIERVREILRDVQYRQPGNKAELAAYNTFAELAFVAPDIITPILVSQISADLDVQELQLYEPMDFAIARTPEGVAFVDVLSKKGQNQALDKNVRDYDTLKWEEEIRSQLAQKKGQPKRLTPDEQAKVNAQLLKEATIREKVLVLEKKLKRGIGTILALATGPPTEADTWIGPSVNCLIQLIKADVGLLVGDAAAECYMACSNCLSSRLGSLKLFVGVATLRALGSSHLPKNVEEEPIGGSVVLFINRIWLSCSQILLREFCTVYVSLESNDRSITYR